MKHFYRAKLKDIPIDTDGWIYFYPHELEDYDSIYIETMGISTRKKDRNGKEIFEGDIVITTPGTFETTYKRVVVFDCPCWEPINICHPITQVVGNIHDNPELLSEVYCYPRSK